MPMVISLILLLTIPCRLQVNWIDRIKSNNFSVVNNKQYDKLNAAYCYYNVSKRLTALMKDMLTVAKQQDFDVFNALDSMDNAEFLKVNLKTSNFFKLIF